MAGPGLNRLFLPCSKSPSCSPCCTRASSSPKQTTGETSTRPRTAAGKAGSQHFPSPRPFPCFSSTTPKPPRAGDTGRHKGKPHTLRLEVLPSGAGCAPLVLAPSGFQLLFASFLGHLCRSLHTHLSSSMAISLAKSFDGSGCSGAQRGPALEAAAMMSSHLSACQHEFGTPDPVPGGR